MTATVTTQHHRYQPMITHTDGNSMLSWLGHPADRSSCRTAAGRS